jgi:hypothetical protein
MANATREIVLSMQHLREVTSYAAESAQEVLEIFERAHPADARPRDAIGAAWSFAGGGERGKTLRDTGRAAHKAARDTDTAAAGDAARAAMCAASAAHLHPLADAHQVKHILGQRPTRRERPNPWRATIEMSVPITLRKLAGARHQSSLTCSAATPRHRLVEGASGSCFAIWMRPSAVVSEALLYPEGVTVGWSGVAIRGLSVGVQSCRSVARAPRRGCLTG